MHAERLTGLDKFFAITLLVVMTQLYRAVALVLGVQSIAMVTAAVTLICIGYLFIKRQVMRAGVHHYLLIFIAMLWPAGTALYAEVIDVRAIAMQFHYLVILLASAALFQKSPRVGYFLGVYGLLVSISAMVISIYLPSAFSAMAAMASARFDYLGRGSGLFLQPNLLAYNLILLAMILAFSVEKREAPKIFVVSIILMLALFFTGSRGGMLAGAAFVAAWILLGRQLVRQRFLLVAVASALPLTLVGMGFLVFADGALIDLSIYMDRVRTLSTSEIVNEGSVQYRLDFQAQFLRMIAESPLIGHGIGSVEYLLDRGELHGAAHNQVLDLVLQYGILGVLPWVLLGFRVLQRVNSKRQISLAGAGVIATLVAIMMGTNMLFDMQNFYILLGALLARSVARATPSAEEPVIRGIVDGFEPKRA